MQNETWPSINCIYRTANDYAIQQATIKLFQLVIYNSQMFWELEFFVCLTLSQIKGLNVSKKIFGKF